MKAIAYLIMDSPITALTIFRNVSQIGFEVSESDKSGIKENRSNTYTQYLPRAVPIFLMIPSYCVAYWSTLAEIACFKLLQAYLVSRQVYFSKCPANTELLKYLKLFISMSVKDS